MQFYQRNEVVIRREIIRLRLNRSSERLFGRVHIVELPKDEAVRIEELRISRCDRKTIEGDPACFVRLSLLIERVCEVKIAAPIPFVQLNDLTKAQLSIWVIFD